MSVSKPGKSASPLGELSALSDTIDQGIKGTEGPFLEFGQDLRAAYAESGDLISVITGAADKFNDASGESLVREVETAIHRVLEELDAYPARVSRDMEIINQGIDRLEGLCRACQGLTNISKYLNIIGMNFGVEACRSREAVALFEGFADEIKALSKRNADIIGKINSDSQSTILHQKKEMARVAEQVIQIKTLTDQAQKSVLSTMENIRTISDHSLKALGKAQQTANTIKTCTGEIVMAIQFHDIARQRLEHVISAFEDVSTMADAQTDDALKDDASQTVRLPAQVPAILRLQSEQMEDVAGEIDQAHVKIKDAMDDIAAKLMALKNVISPSSKKRDRQDLVAVFKSMAEQLESLSQIQQQADHIGDEMLQTVKESSQIVTVLSQYADEIKNINIDIQYKALNAIIMTNKLGEKGRTLGVLAKEVRTLSASCNTMVEGVVVHLNEIAEVTVQLTEAHQENGAAQTQSSLSKQIAGISLAMEDHTRDVSAVSEGANTLAGKLKIADENLSFMEEWTRQLLANREKLETLITSILPLVSEKTDTGEHDQTLSDRYTMKSEREIHQRIIDKDRSGIEATEEMSQPPTDDGKGKPDRGSDTSEKTEEFDENIELF